MVWLNLLGCWLGLLAVMGLLLEPTGATASACVPYAEHTWMPHLGTDDECQRLMQCSLNNYSWPTPSCSTKVTGREACSRLREVGVSNIILLGDSYSRHMIVALFLILSNDHLDHAHMWEIMRLDAAKNANFSCLDAYAQNTYECRRNYPNNARVCGGNITLTLRQDLNIAAIHQYLKPVTSLPEHRGTATFFSFGNHQVLKGQGLRYGINNATMHFDILDEMYCQFSRAGRTDVHLMSNIWWISTHRRVQGFDSDETASRVLEFNLKMRENIEHNCPGIGYIDVYNMTHRLIEDHADQVPSLSYDGVHWNLPVNMNKAHTILDTIFHEFVLKSIQ